MYACILSFFMILNKGKYSSTNGERSEEKGSRNRDHRANVSGLLFYCILFIYLNSFIYTLVNSYVGRFKVVGLLKKWLVKFIASHHNIHPLTFKFLLVCIMTSL